MLKAPCTPMVPPASTPLSSSSKSLTEAAIQEPAPTSKSLTEAAIQEPAPTNTPPAQQQAGVAAPPALGAAQVAQQPKPMDINTFSLTNSLDLGSLAVATAVRK